MIYLKCVEMHGGKSVWNSLAVPATVIALIGSLVFFLITNFGVWSLGTYGYTINSLILCYTLAIPFFSYSLISTFIFSGIIETVYKFLLIKKFSFIKL